MFQYPRADRLIVGAVCRVEQNITIQFQYPRADRLIVGGAAGGDADDDGAVSVSSCGSTYCWGPLAQLLHGRVARFQYPRADRLIVGGADPAALPDRDEKFQYPRADRLIVGGLVICTNNHAHGSFSILVRIDLLLGLALEKQQLEWGGCFSILVRIDLLLGRAGRSPALRIVTVSVSSCGSTYCWGVPRWAPPSAPATFQYPRADRLIVGGRGVRAVRVEQRRFQYPRADRLIVGGHDSHQPASRRFLFQYPRADRLIVGGDAQRRAVGHHPVSVSSCGSTYCWGY